MDQFAYKPPGLLYTRMTPLTSLTGLCGQRTDKPHVVPFAGIGVVFGLGFRVLACLLAGEGQPQAAGNI